MLSFYSMVPSYYMNVLVPRFEPIDMGIRDIELGYRLKARGEQIRFYKDLEVKLNRPGFPGHGFS